MYQNQARFDAIMHPINSYSSPPVMVNVAVMPGVAHLVPAIAVSIANSLGRTAGQTYTRTYVYNTVAANGFNNPNYAELVKLTADVLALDLNSGSFNLPEQGLDRAVETAITLYTSVLAIGNNQLFTFLDRQVQEAVRANAMRYQDVVNRINTMYNSMNIQQPMMQPMPQQMGYQQMPIQQPMGMMQQPIVNQAGYFNQNTAMISTGVNSTVNSRVNDRFANTRPAQMTPEPVTPVPVESVLVIPEKGEWKTSKEQPFRSVYMKDVHEPVLTRVNDVLVEKLEMNMDRNAHRLKVGDDVYNIDLIAKREETIDSVAQLNKSSLDTVEAVHNQEEVDTTMVNPDTIGVAYLEEAIFETKVLAKVNSVSAYRSYFALTTPIIDPVYIALRKALEELSVVKLTDVADILNKLATEENRDSIANLDIQYTRLVNEMLECSLSLPGVNIDSFMSDVYDLKGYLNKKFGTRMGVAMENFEANYLSAKILMISEEQLEIARSNFTDALEVYFDTNLISVTYLDVYDKALNLAVDYETKMIDQGFVPWLYSLANRLVSEQDNMNLQTIDNYLVTKDNVIYRIIPASYAKNVQFIKKHC